MRASENPSCGDDWPLSSVHPRLEVNGALLLHDLLHPATLYGLLFYSTHTNVDEVSSIIHRVPRLGWLDHSHFPTERSIGGKASPISIGSTEHVPAVSWRLITP